MSNGIMSDGKISDGKLSTGKLSGHRHTADHMVFLNGNSCSVCNISWWFLVIGYQFYLEFYFNWNIVIVLSWRIIGNLMQKIPTKIEEEKNLMTVILVRTCRWVSLGSVHLCFRLEKGVRCDCSISVRISNLNSTKSTAMVYINEI